MFGALADRLDDALQDAGVRVTVAQPGCIKHFAQSLNVLAKTDALDAQLIARFGTATQPDPTPQTPENQRHFRALVDRRGQVIEDRVRETNRLETCADADMRANIQAHVTSLPEQEHAEQEHALDQQIAAAVQADSELHHKQQVLSQLKGVGPQTVCAWLAHLPELGSLNRQQVAAIAGLAPHPQESGNWKGKRHIFGGRAPVRKAMFMAARSAARWCPVRRPFYERLMANGKPYKQAIIACARKMLIRLNTLLKEIPLETSAPNGTQST